MTEPRQLNPQVPADAVEIVAAVAGRMRYDGPVSDVGAMLLAIQTLRQVHAPQGLAEAKAPT